MTDWITSGAWNLDEGAKARLEAAKAEVKGPRVLDIGSRDGTFSLTLAKEHPDWTIHGFDTDASFVAYTNRKAQEIAPNATYFQDDLTQPRSMAGFLASYDTVICMETLEHIDIGRAGAAFDNGLAFVKAGGQYIVSVPANTHISDPDHKGIYFREQFQGKPNLQWVRDCPHLWMMFVVTKATGVQA